MKTMAAGKGVVFNRLGGQPVKKQVCRYWLAGRCNKNSCRFMHESAPSQNKAPNKQHSHVPTPDDVGCKQTKKSTWRNPNYHCPKDGSVSTSNGRDTSSVSGKSDHTGQDMPSVANDSCTQAQPKVLTVVRNGPDKSSLQKGQSMQCKYWVTGNCVYGEKCKYLHSWFCGSGFTMLAKLEGHTKDVTGISLPSNNDKLYSSGNDGTIRVWDCNSGQSAGSVETDCEVGCLVSEGPWLFAGLQNNVKVWNFKNHSEFSLNGPVGLVRSMVVDDDKLFAGIEDGTILVWNLIPETNIPELAAILKEHNGAVCSLVIGAGRLYSGSRDCTIKVWDLQNLQCLQTLYEHTKDVMSVLCWDSYLLSASLDNTLKIWASTENGTIEVVYEIKKDCEVLALCGILDAELRPILLCSSGDSTVRLYDLPSFTERGRIFSKREVRVIQIGIDGLFFTGDATGDVSVWKLLGAAAAAL